MTFPSCDEKEKAGNVESISVTQPVSLEPSAGVVGSEPDTVSMKTTVAESVIQFCTINKNSSELQIMLFLIAEQQRRVERGVNSYQRVSPVPVSASASLQSGVVSPTLPVSSA